MCIRDRHTARLRQEAAAAAELESRLEQQSVLLKSTCAELKALQSKLASPTPPLDRIAAPPVARKSAPLSRAPSITAMDEDAPASPGQVAAPVAAIEGSFRVTTPAAVASTRPFGASATGAVTQTAAAPAPFGSHHNAPTGLVGSPSAPLPWASPVATVHAAPSPFGASANAAAPNLAPSPFGTAVAPAATPTTAPSPFGGPAATPHAAPSPFGASATAAPTPTLSPFGSAAPSGLGATHVAAPAPFGTPAVLTSFPTTTVSYTHLRAHETVLDLVCRLLLEKKNTTLL
eukprot:TRINITY_DN2207_c0_g1_i1.p1 TRINITY_DN2207_c0_g1~~TRINITY_DN2207_c0_g1_i1.p1  ORF type:complete len:289 (-),score=56.72 TRINITY_DN2207_c0_g1_i1:13-879(-)